MKFFSKNHFHAILFRKLIIFKRSWLSNLFYLLSSLAIASSSIIFHYIVVSFKSKLTETGDFSKIDQVPNALVFINDSSFPNFDLFVNSISTKYTKEIGYSVPIFSFENYTELNQFSYECAKTGKYLLSFGSSISISPNNYDMPSYSINILYNSTDEKVIDALVNEIIITDGIWKTIFGASSSFNYTNILLTKKYQDTYLIPMRLLLIFSSYSYFIPLLLTHSINDVLGNSLLYMSSCGLSVFSYWLATFIIDYLIWIVFSASLWLAFFLFKIPSFVASGYYVFYAFIMSGPSVLLFSYVLIHFLSNQNEAQKQLFFVFIGFVITQHVIEIINKSRDPPFWEEVLSSFIPPISMYRSILITSTSKYRTKLVKQINNINDINLDEILIQPYQTLFKKFDIHNIYFCHFIMDYINIIIYGTFLSLIGRILYGYNKKKDNITYAKNKDIFINQKRKVEKEMTKEALMMEEEVRNSSPNDYAIRINNVSRLFFDNDKTPILAVNSVSLGIKQGISFGFLGANGAGKTTLISMITSMLPTSNGTIEIDGEDINNLKDRSIISVCPQFNDHLIQEMTPLEHFTLYSYIFNMNKAETRKKINDIVDCLELHEILNRKLSEISFGDLRKLAVALSFFGPSKVIFLDEPTTSLDSNSRELVHKIILKNKSTKNILLCTHLLNEAEILCDQISIMSKGCIYALDSPQNLNKKFGTSIKIDVFLNDNDNEANNKCSNFFNRNIPKAVLAIERPKSRIYRISNQFITFPQLFRIMEEGRKDPNNGFYSFTCTSSSLEQTFLEIVKLSENGEVDASISLLRAAQESTPSV
ncbi:hypothetical protein M9Y10_013198 [Tritrichomonas musculus]|uniref:ABC transporter domain-containing protein n=1 Tax=Tritrichomonas musculus TaxID=1915356 RepID=A0ABR2I6D6_9EUKA